VLNVNPKHLLSAVGKTTADRREARRSETPRPLPPSWRTCRLTMSRAYFFAIVGGWLGALAALLAVALTIRWP
jgi:hypothetical protein